MTDSEVSVEATVAGEAAAAAVEEVHSREEVVETANSAFLESAVAADTAAAAIDTAALAESQAADAAEIAVAATEAAAEAQQAVYLTADMMQSIREESDAKLREMREYIDTRIPLPPNEPETPAVEEIEAESHGGTTGVSDSGGSTSADGSAEKSGAEAGQPRQERYSLRRGRR
jgi:hypothetical protein